EDGIRDGHVTGVQTCALPILTPDERQRVLDRYREWQQLSPEQRQSARQNFKRFQALPPQEKQRILQDLSRWNALPEARRQELQRSEEHTSELQSRGHLVCRLL